MPGITVMNAVLCNCPAVKRYTALSLEICEGQLNYYVHEYV
jgi:hypothetical protein